MLLLAATVAALVWANSPWHVGYDTAWHGWRHHAVNDGLMSVFFLAVGCEVKRELTIGTLRDRAHATVPALAALGGMAVPALVYLAVARHQPGGWGVPMATDVAFALAVLSAAGPRVTRSMRAFLLTLAVVDDIGAVVVIALFYRPPGLPVHPTLLAVVLGLALPVRHAGRVERALGPWSALVVLPVFALANAGVRIVGGDERIVAVTIGVAAGLVVGKVVGITGATALAVRLRLGRLPADLGLGDVAAVGLIAGVGFTVALLVAGLAFPGSRPATTAAKVGVLGGSALAAVAGALAVRLRARSGRF
jgi:NhaA family Na+:H+ antiporter